MKIKVYWVFLHGGIEQVWEGDYKARKGIAIGRAYLDEPKHTINVAIENDERVIVSGERFREEQIGRVHRRSADLLEIELFAGS